jgi:hypothetical protein
MKFKINAETLGVSALVLGLGAAAYWFLLKPMYEAGGSGLSVTRIVPGDYGFGEAPGGTIVGDTFVPVGGANIRPMVEGSASWGSVTGGTWND